jgi:ABC-2 type transport system permease protein
MDLLRLYWAYVKNAFAVEAQYRMAMVIWLLHLVLEPTIYLVVWSTVARAQGNVGGYDARDFSAYYLAMMMVNHLTFTWVAWDFDFRIRMGQLSFDLLRPVHPIHNDIVENFTYKAVTQIVMIPAVIVLAWFFQPRIEWKLWVVAMFVPALVLAYFVRFFFEWALAHAAFWTTRTIAFNEMYYVVLVFMGGRIAPLELLPEPLRIATQALPFRWMLYFPVELLTGKLTPSEAALGLLAQCAWIGVGLLVMNLTWRAGLKRYSAVGS